MAKTSLLVWVIDELTRDWQAMEPGLAEQVNAVMLRELVEEAIESYGTNSL